MGSRSKVTLCCCSASHRAIPFGPVTHALCTYAEAMLFRCDIVSWHCPHLSTLLPCGAPPLCLLVSTFCRAVSRVVKHGLFRLSSFPHDLVCPISKCEYLESFFLLPSCYVESKERPNNNSGGLEMKLWEVSRATPSN